MHKAHRRGVLLGGIVGTCSVGAMMMAMGCLGDDTSLDQSTDGGSDRTVVDSPGPDVVGDAGPDGDGSLPGVVGDPRLSTLEQRMNAALCQRYAGCCGIIVGDAGSTEAGVWNESQCETDNAGGWTFSAR